MGTASENKKKINGIPSLQREQILPYLGIMLLIGAVYLVSIVFYKYAWPAFLALLLYVGFCRFNTHLLQFISRSKLRFSGQNIAAAISTVLAFTLIIIPSAMLIKKLIAEIYWLAEQLQAAFVDGSLVKSLETLPFISNFVTQWPFFWVGIFNTMAELIKVSNAYLDPNQIGSWLGGLFTFLQGGLDFTLSFVFNLFLVIILLFFLFRDGPALYKFIKFTLPFPMHITDRFTDRMQQTILDVLKGNVFIAILQGTAIGGALFLCGFESFVSYGTIAAVFSVIPIVGTGVVWLPSSIYLATVQSRYLAAILLATYAIAMYLILENIVKPKLLDSKLGIHPLFLFFSILGGLAEFGISGIILGPLFLVLLKTLWNIYHVWDIDSAPTDAQNK